MADFNQEDTGMTKAMVTQALPGSNLDNLQGEDLDKLYNETMNSGPVSSAPVEEKLAAEKKVKVQEQVVSLKEQLAHEVEPAAPAGADGKSKPVPIDVQMAGLLNPIPAGARGIAYGMRGIVRTGYNSLVDIADWVENKASEMGAGSGQMITEADKISKNSKDIQIGPLAIGLGEGDRGKVSDYEKINEIVTSVAVPIAASVGTGGLVAAASSGMIGGIVGVGLDATLNALLTDESSRNLSNLLKDTSAAEWPIAGNIIDHLAVKPDDSAMTAKAKMFGESVGLSTLAGAIWGISRLAAGANRLKNFSKGVDAAASAVEADAKVIPKVADMSQEALNASDNAVSSVQSIEGGAIDLTEKPSAQTKAFSDQFEKEWANLEQKPVSAKIDPKTGTVSTRLTDDEAIVHVENALERLPDKNLLRTPMTDVETATVADAMKNDPDILDRILSHPGDRVLTDTETLVLRHHIEQYGDNIKTVIGEVLLDPKNPTEQIKAARAIGNFIKLGQLSEGAASAKGATLRAEQLLGRMAGLGDKEALKQLGAMGRADLYRQLVESYGGSEKINEMVNNLAFLAKAREIDEIPDAAWKLYKGQIKVRSRFESYRDLLTKIAWNGMVSGASSVKATLSNFATTATTVAENYLMAVTPGAEMSIADANTHLAATIDTMFDSLTVKKAWNDMKDPMLNLKSHRADLDVGLSVSANASPDQIAKRQMGMWAQTVGMVDDLTINNKKLNKVIEAPTRLLVGVDSYWNMVNERAYVKMMAVRSTQGMSGAERVSAIAKYVDQPPRDVLEKAVQIGRTNTMSKDLTGVMEDIKKGTEGVAEVVTFGSGLGKVVAPFMKTQLNTLEYGLMHSPFGLVAPKTLTALKQGGAARDEALAKVASGTMLMMGVTYLAHSGDIVGKWDPNSADRAIPGVKGPAIKIPGTDKYFSVAGIEPLETAVNLGHLMNKIGGYLTTDQSDEAGAAMAGMLAEVVLPETMVETMADLAKVLSTDPKTKGAFPKYMAELATKYIPFSGAFRMIRNEIDPTIRDTAYDTFHEMVAAKFGNIVPGFSENYPAQRDMFGNKITIPDGFGPDSISPVVGIDKKTLEIKKNFERIMAYANLVKGTDSGLMQYKPEKPGRNVSVGGGMQDVKLSPEQYSQYLVAYGGRDPKTGKSIDGGPSYQDMVEDVFKRYKFKEKNPREMGMDYASMISELTELDKYAEERGKMWVSQNPEIMDKFLEKTNKFNSIVLGQEVQGGR